MRILCRIGFHKWDRWVTRPGCHNWNVGVKCLKCGIMPWGDWSKRPLKPPPAPIPKPR